MLDVRRLRDRRNVIQMNVFATIVFSVAIAASSCHSGLQAPSHSADSNCTLAPTTGPLVVLVNSSAGAVIPGSVPPRFVLYADGTVVYTAKGDSGYGYVTSRLTPCEVVSLVKEIGPGSITALNGQQFSASTATDQSVSSLMIWQPDASVVVASVYGWHSDWRSEWSGPDAMAPPPELDEALRTVVRFSRPDAVPYEPPAFRFYDGGGGYLPMKPIGKWPSHWPDLSLAKPIGFGPWRAINVGGLTTEEVRSVLGASNLHFWCSVTVARGKTAVMYRPVFRDEASWSVEIGLTSDTVASAKPAPN